MAAKEEEEKENYVGRTVQKYFAGFGFFNGKVISFNRARRFFKVKYDDGDREELELKELKEILVGKDVFQAPAEKPKSRRGRKRKSDAPDGNGIEAGNPSGTDVRECVKNTGDDCVAEGVIEDKNLPLEKSMVQNLDAEDLATNLGGINEVREDGGEQKEEQSLQPLVPVSLFSAFEMADVELERKAVPLGSDIDNKRARRPAMRASDGPPRSLKRTRVTPTSESFRKERPPFQDLNAGIDEDIVTLERREETDLVVPAVTSFPDVSPDATGQLSNHTELDGDLESEAKFVATGNEESAPVVLSLPPSSTSLGAIDHCVADLFQVYSMLRSFSHVIFLSPFSLEEFVCALSLKDVSSIVDCVHLSLLQTLRRQLERLSKNGSKSATFTLRLSDWSLLDNIAWPSFLMAFLLTQGFAFEHGHTWVKAGLSVVEYYKLSVGTKLSILSFLCDKVLDTEEAKAELARRALLENDSEIIDPRGSLSKKQNWKDSTICEGDFEDELPGTFRTGTRKDSGTVNTDMGAPSTADSIRVGRHLDEDGNLDECVLCAMDGNLICCDGCPAAYHSRCVGVTRQGLPPGDWFCPECRADKRDQRGARISKGVRGGELFPVGPGGQLFLATCGYLLISQRGLDGQVVHRYYSPQDLPVVVKVLEEAGPMFIQLRAAVQLLSQPVTNATTMPAANGNVASAEEPSCLLSTSQDEHNHNDPIFCVNEELPVEHKNNVPVSSSIFEETNLDLNVPYSTLMVADGDCCANTSSQIPPETYMRELDLNMCDQMNGLEAGGCCGPLMEEHEKIRLHGGHDVINPVNTIKFREAGILSMSGEFDEIWKQNSSNDQTHLSSKLQNHEQNPVEPSEVISTSTPGLLAIPLSDCYETTTQDMEDGVTRLMVPPQGNHDERKIEACDTSVDRGTSEHLHTEQMDVRDCPGKPVVPGKDYRVRNAEREQISSSLTQITACNYTNNYSNCDFVATASYNLAVIAGCVDELVEDRNGNPRKSKPTSNSEQTKAFTQASGHFFWPSLKKRSMDIPKEKCGWCINCRSIGRRGCLLTQVGGQMAGGTALVAGGIRPIKGGYGHYPAVGAYILYMEENLHGLLGGPWELPGHRKSWRKQVEQAKSIRDVKVSLLELESNLRNVSLSADWDKFEEDAPESIASSVVISSGNGVFMSKKFAPKKRGRPAVITKTPATNSYDGTCFGVYWWRGASVSRQVYNWESLPRSAVKRAGRKGGFKEIAELVYMKNLDLPRRTRRVAWRTRLEKISSIAQLAVEVRHLDTFIKWNDIISPREASTTHNIKGQPESGPSFRNSEIQGKSDESGSLMYLLGLPVEVDETKSSPLQQVDSGTCSMEIPANKKKQEASEGGVWVAERDVPLFLLKEYEKKMRTINHSKLPKSLKKGKMKPFKTKASFWELLCSAQLGGLLDSKKLSDGLCEHCKLSCSEIQSVECHRCSGRFHSNCAEVEDSIDGREKVSVCKSCIKVRLGQRLRRPSYKMLVMQSQSPDGGVLGYKKEVVVADSVERASKSGKDSIAQHQLLGRKRNQTESECDTTPWVKRQYRKKNKNLTLGSPEAQDLTQPKKKRGRKKKVIPLDTPQGSPTVERRKSGRIRNSLSPTAVPKPEQETPLRAKRKYAFKLSKKSLRFARVGHLQNESSVISRRMSERQKQRPPVVVDDYSDSDLETKKSPLKRKRLKIIFAGLRRPQPDADVQEEAPKRKSGNGLNFGSRIARSEADVQQFRQEKLILPDQVGPEPGNGPICGLCSGGYEPGQLFVGCEYCKEWYHGEAVGLKTVDGPFLVGYKCHKCRKCRAPSCPAMGGEAAVKTRRRKRTVDHGEVIDAENVNRSARMRLVSSAQSSWQTSPGQEYCAFSDGKAFPDFVAATNQAEAALAVDNNNFGHVLAENFDMSDLALPGDPQLQLPPMSLGDQQVNMWPAVDSTQLGLHVFPTSHAHQSAPPSISFTELLASEDDYFEGVPSTGLGMSTDWAGEMYPSDNLDGPQRLSSVAETEFFGLENSLPSSMKETELASLDKESAPSNARRPCSVATAKCCGLEGSLPSSMKEAEFCGLEGSWPSSMKEAKLTCLDNESAQ